MANKLTRNPAKTNTILDSILIRTDSRQGWKQTPPELIFNG